MVGDLTQLVGDGGDRGRDRVLPGVAEYRCHTGNSGSRHRQFRAWKWGIPGSCGEVFRKFLEPSVWWFRDGAGTPPQPRPCPLPPGLVVSRRHWRASSTTAMRPPGSSPATPRRPSLLLRLRPDDGPQRRGGLDTRSLALAARPPGRLARLLNRSRGLPGGPRPRAVPLPVAAPSNPMTTRSREEVSTSAHWRSLLDHRGWAEVSRRRWRASSTTAARYLGARCSTTQVGAALSRRLARLLNHRPARTRERTATPSYLSPSLRLSTR